MSAIFVSHVTTSNEDTVQVKLVVMTFDNQCWVCVALLTASELGTCPCTCTCYMSVRFLLVDLSEYDAGRSTVVNLQQFQSSHGAILGPPGLGRNLCLTYWRRCQGNIGPSSKDIYLNFSTGYYMNGALQLSRKVWLLVVL